MTPQAMPGTTVGAAEAPPAQEPSAAPYRPPAPQPAGVAANDATSTPPPPLEYGVLLEFALVTIGAFLAGLAVTAIQKRAARYGGWSLSQIARRSR